ncbi:MFS general substrate transporter [Lentinus tigrinus ALCF2SS1-6]|uniref:MFS general substrate transporter n=1 Tax=Lentinus tigrinus ALCF2SS1-6 TaxID=1328759 RepID=A0A5C2S4H1_9APHY|nr:MFS general substrate transporter [Lentinus tigrinus ALCF2SS1-6]
MSPPSPATSTAASDPEHLYHKSLDHDDNARGRPFWLAFVAVSMCTFVSALDFTAVPTALSTITADLRVTGDSIWIVVSYGIASAAILPLSGRFADAFGRKPVLLTAVVLYFVGSIVSGVASNVGTLIVGRTVQGMGGGAMLNLVQIIVADLVPLAERGTYVGMLACVWAVAAGVGALIAGSLARVAEWRLNFYLNLPLAAIAFFLVSFCVRLQRPAGSFGKKLSQLDILGNLIIISGTTLLVVGLTWGGMRYNWTDVHVLATLIPGIVLLGLFFMFECCLSIRPSIPLEAVDMRTTISGYIATFFHGVLTAALFYFLPIYLQTSKGLSALGSGLLLLPAALVVAMLAFVAGTLVKVLQVYRWANMVAGGFSLLGFGLLSTMTADASAAQWVGYQILAAAGLGLGFVATVFPVLAPVPVTHTASALSLFSFTRAFAQTLGVVTGTIILQSQLKSRLPSELNGFFTGHVELAHAAIPLIAGLADPLRRQVRVAFADSLKLVWDVMLGVSALGMLPGVLMREVRMERVTDDRYGLRTGSGSEVQAHAQSSEEKTPLRSAFGAQQTEHSSTSSSDGTPQPQSRPRWGGALWVQLASLLFFIGLFFESISM